MLWPADSAVPGSARGIGEASAASLVPQPFLTLRSDPVDRTLLPLPAQPTPLIGRERELERARELLLAPAVRLLTVVGPPGIGKTRLALELALGLRGRFRDGVCFVPLAPLRSPDQVAATIALMLGVQE